MLCEICREATAVTVEGMCPKCSESIEDKSLDLDQVAMVDFCLSNLSAAYGGGEACQIGDEKALAIERTCDEWDRFKEALA